MTPDQIYVPIITVFVSIIGTALVNYFVLLKQARTELKKEYESRFNEKKWDAYLRFVQSLPLLTEINFLVKKANKKTISSEERLKLDELADTYHQTEKQVESEMLLLGSKETVKAFLEWQSLTQAIDAKDEWAVETLVGLINHMRMDLGQEKSTLIPDDLDGTYYFSSKKSKEIREEYQKNVQKHGEGKTKTL